ncbi:prepilin peptidase [Desulfofundulus thermosubterraneus]|uniref:Type 4 prepilin peptidase 1. Aspartic peptidase. MEROPS family A24A n=1 Tax=Desulfofundulus thermosubterraneus DSM 16057 TaxID=1121432 RepID=A0A1M6H192_9FIRM|nr:A24 family peptidase [Desulfofundulus thermosubterraneus]SHJ15990.1 type 4 prepilin peptidase 1 . Aspartic peptidase. MEROPS family A24A [Desulfofundulus thermosubterraneus DSM 16057]
MTAIFFLSGLFAGSFLNVVIHRVPRGESVFFPGSRCPACGRRLAPVELVPVLSYVWLKGRCRQCGAKISLRYPLVELLTGLLFASLFLRFGISSALLKYMVLACVLVVVTFTDIEHMLIPDKVIVFAVVSGAVLDLALGADPAAVLLGALIPAAFLYFLAVTTKGGVGGGDIKLAFATGLFLGWNNVLAVMVAFILGGLVGTALLASGKKGRKDAMVFGPFLAAGMLASALWGQAAVNWYLNR